ncbi:MAG: hypothetical protein HKN26_04540 [Acidimicrobiales bacterium]|nr:hypothetical protein [Acidimicrobiales bacterium]
MLVWVIVIVGLVVVVAGALVAVGRVTNELEHTISPAELRVDDAVAAVAEALPFEVAAQISHDDVERIIGWVLDWFDEVGLASDFGEELAGDWVGDRTVTVDETEAADRIVARAVRTGSALDAVHVTVVVDEFMAYLRDIGAIAGEVG